MADAMSTREQGSSAAPSGLWGLAGDGDYPGRRTPRVLDRAAFDVERAGQPAPSAPSPIVPTTGATTWALHDEHLER